MEGDLSLSPHGTEAETEAGRDEGFGSASVLEGSWPCSVTLPHCHFGLGVV